MKTILKLIICLCLTSQAFSQYMYVNDPQSWWHESGGSIDNLEITIEPNGVYAQVDMAFDVFTSEEDFFHEGSPLEFVFDFKMPDNIIFQDSWLWIEDYISKGEIYEVNEGTQIYEDIVDRQQDPSILTKVNSEYYNLKIYPLQADSTRRVMLSYLVPMDFTKVSASTKIPYDVFYTSQQTPQNITLIVKQNENWNHEEYLSSNATLIYSDAQESVYSIASLYDTENVIVSYNRSDLTQDHILSTFEEEGVQYFNLAYFPTSESNIEGKNHMIIVDIDINNFRPTSGVDRLLSDIKHNLKSNLRDNDKFNICYSDFVIKLASENWIDATEENINLVLDEIISSGIDYDSRFQSLLPTALEFINSKGEKANITLLSSSTDYNSIQESENYHESLNEYISENNLMSDISIIDVAFTNRRTLWVDNERFYGNGYMYHLITRDYNGQYVQLNDIGQVSEVLKDFFSTNLISIDSPNFEVDFANGFTYDTYTDFSNNNLINLDNPIITVGKYVGEFPLEVSFYGFKDGEPFINETELTDTEVFSTEIDIKKIWTREFILENEYSSDFDDRLEVVDYSFEERLLSAHTIFLCLEPDLMTISQNNLNDDLILSSSNGPFESNVLIYPNPFQEELFIELPIDDLKDFDNSKIQLINTNGQLVKESVANPEIEGEVAVFKITAQDDWESGLYVIRLITGDKVFARQVLFVSK